MISLQDEVLEIATHETGKVPHFIILLERWFSVSGLYRWSRISSQSYGVSLLVRFAIYKNVCAMDIERVRAQCTYVLALVAAYVWWRILRLSSSSAASAELKVSLSVDD